MVEIDGGELSAGGEITVSSAPAAVTVGVAGNPASVGPGVVVGPAAAVGAAVVAAVGVGVEAVGSATPLCVTHPSRSTDNRSKAKAIFTGS